MQALNCVWWEGGVSLEKENLLIGKWASHLHCACLPFTTPHYHLVHLVMYSKRTVKTVSLMPLAKL